MGGPLLPRLVLLLVLVLLLQGARRAGGTGISRSSPLYWSSTALGPDASAARFDEFGSAVAMKGDTALLGAPLEDAVEGGAHSVGAVYAFTKRDPGWHLAARLVPPDGATGDLFGGAVALSPTASYVLVGAKHAFDTDAGKAYLFARDQSTVSSGSSSAFEPTDPAVPASWSYTCTMSAADRAVGDHFGTSIAISDRHAVISAPGRSDSAGVVFVFEQKADEWLCDTHRKLHSALPAAGNFFGASVALHRKLLVVGSPGADLSAPYGVRAKAGIVEIFVENRTASPTTNTSDPAWAPGTWPRLSNTLTPFTTDPVSTDGTALATNESTDNSGASLDKFGNALAIGPGTLLASAHYDDTAGYVDTGTVFSYVFDYNQVVAANGTADALFLPAQQLSLVDTTISEVQTIECAANTGSFRLQLGAASQRTNAISATAALSVLKEELEALDSVEHVDVQVLVAPPYVETSVRNETTYTMVNISMNVTELRNATNATTNVTYAYNWTGTVMTLRNVSTSTTVQFNTTHTPAEQTTVCGDPLGAIDATHPQKVSITFVSTTYGRGNDVPELVYVPVDLNVDAPASAPDANVAIATLTQAAGPQDDLLQIYDQTYFGEAISVSPSGRFAAVGATHEIIGGKVNVYEVVRLGAAVSTSTMSANSSTATNSSSATNASSVSILHTGIWKRVMGMNASAETTSFEGASRIPVSQNGHRFGGALSMSDDFVIIGARLADLVDRGSVVNTTNVTTHTTTPHLNMTSNATYNVTTSSTRQILHYNYSDVPDRGAGYVFAIVPDPPTGVRGTVADTQVLGLQFQVPVNSNAHPVLDYHVRAIPLNYSVFNVAIDDTNTDLGFHGHSSTLRGVGVEPLPSTNVKFTPSSTVHDYVFVNDTSSANILHGLTNGQAYNVTVRARSSVGYSMYSYAMGPFIPAAVPDAATVDPNLAAQVAAQQAGIVSDGNIRVSATLPAWNGGGIVLEMEASLVPVLGAGSFSERNGRPTEVLTQRTTNATHSFAKPGVSQTFFRFTDLVNGIGYLPRVRVRNWKGWGAYGLAGGESLAENAATIIPAAVPGEPTVVKAIGGNRNITVHFTEPAIESGAALLYKLTVYQEGKTVNDGSDSRSWTTMASPGVVTGLDNGQSYRISISAANWMGESPRSTASDAVIPATTPDGVEGLSVAPGDMHIDVAWRPPSEHGGANVTSYLIWLTAADSSILLPTPVTVQAIPGAVAYSVSFGDEGESQMLDSNWIQHTVHVAATNRVGQGTVARLGTMPVFYGLRPWQTVLIVLLSVVSAATMVWVWKVKRRNPFTCKPLDGSDMASPSGNKVAPEFGAVLGVGVANTAISGGSAGGMGLINTDLGVGLPARESRLRSNLRAGDSVTVNQQVVPSSQGRSRAAKGGQRMVF